MVDSVREAAVQVVTELIVSSRQATFNGLVSGPSGAVSYAVGLVPKNLQFQSKNRGFHAHGFHLHISFALTCLPAASVANIRRTSAHRHDS